MASKSNNSTQKRKVSKPTGFPLTRHLGAGQWCKKFGGKTFYFGILSDPDAALAEYLRTWEYITTGRNPPTVGADEHGSTLTIADLLNTFVASKESKLNGRKLSPHTFSGYLRAGKLIVDQFGRDRRVSDLKPVDFEAFRQALETRFPPDAGLCGIITSIRAVMNFAHDMNLITTPVSFGPSFDRPDAKGIRRQKRDRGPKSFTAEELRTIISALAGEETTTFHIDPETGKPTKITRPANPAIRAMVLLGVNAGFGNHDCATLKKSSVDLQTGWVEHARPKTEVDRRVPLWPETVAALKLAFSKRPKPVDPENYDLAFVTQQGHPFVRSTPKLDDEGRVEKVVSVDSITIRMADVLRSCGITGRTFYGLRHTTETIGGKCCDQVAVDAVMGHSDGSMAANYRDGVDDSRLRKVTDTIHGWLFPPVAKKSTKRKGGAK